jgi:phage internal scaffolding protein
MQIIERTEEEKLANPHSLRRVRKEFKKPSMTEQAHKDDCDIRKIMAKAQATGMVSHTNAMAAKYGDLSSAPDFQDAQNIIAEANSQFETIPSKVREEFNNDPMEWLEFIHNEDNREEMIKMGFSDDHLPPLEQEEPVVRVEVTNPPEESESPAE